MKKMIIGLTCLCSLSTFALEGCEIIGRTGNSAYRNGAQTSGHYTLEKCAKELVKVVNRGGWEVGAAQHVNSEGEFTHLKYQKISRAEFFKIRNSGEQSLKGE